MTTLFQEIWRETVRHEENAAEAWTRTYRESDCFSKQPPDEGLDQYADEQPRDANYVVPGYAGHVPQSKFVYSKTFGSMTRDLGSSEHMGGHNARRARNPYRFQQPNVTQLPPLSPTRASPPPMDHHPSGYGGHVPGGQFSFAKTYAAVTRSAIAPMNAKYEQTRRKREEEHRMKYHNRKTRTNRLARTAPAF